MISEWEGRNLVCVNARKTQSITFSQESSCLGNNIIMSGTALTSTNSLPMLGVKGSNEEQ